MVDSVINNKGVIEANSIGTHNGIIVLSAATGASKGAGAPTQTVKLSGRISAAGKDKGTKGGTVVVTGENIQLAGATIDASGDAGSGHVLIGGDTGGGHPSSAAANIELAKLESFGIPTATSVSVDAASVINTSATGSGNGGKVVLWSDQQTTFAGTILARGGAAGGDGGFLETSSHQMLAYTGTVDLRAPLGKVGTLLLDPADFYINPDTRAPEVPPGASVMTELQIERQLALGNVTITTSTTTNPSGQNGDIFVYSNINWSTNSTLTLSAYRDINIEPGVTISNFTATEGPLATGNLVLRADNTGIGIGTVTFVPSVGFDSGPNYGTIDFSGSNGTVSIFYNPAGNDNTKVNAASYTTPTDFSGNVTGGKLAAYMLVNTVFDLQNVQNNLTGTYALGRNIDASATASWNGGAGFLPIGIVNTILVGQCIEFQACYHGGAPWSASLTAAQLKSLGSEASLDADQTSQFVIRLGATTMTFSTPGDPVTERLPQFNGGFHSDPCNACANTTLGTFSIPKNATSATISGTFGNSQASSSAGVDILLASLGPSGFSGTFNGLGHTIDGLALKSNGPSLGLFALIGAGGIVKNLDLSNVTIAGTGGGQQIGALAGRNDGIVSNVSAAGTISGGGALAAIGGLIGYNTGTIQSSLAGVTVTGALGDAGGLVGSNYGTIRAAYATGAVTGSAQANIGGLVGYNNGSATQTYATGLVTGASTSSTGALVGWNEGGGNVTQSYWDATIAGSLPGVGLNNEGAFSAAGLVI